MTTQFPIAPIGVCNYTCGWGLQEKLSLQGSMCSRWVKGKKGVLCPEKSAKARERQMLEMAVSLGAACHSGAAAQGTRDGVKEIQREEWERAYHKGPFIHMGHLDRVV